jgi:hypothetical protein
MVSDYLRRISKYIESESNLDDAEISRRKKWLEDAEKITGKKFRESDSNDYLDGEYDEYDIIRYNIDALYHAGPDPDLKKNFKNGAGLFGSVLFFTHKEGGASTGDGTYVYAIDKDSLDIASDLTREPLCANTPEVKYLVKELESIVNINEYRENYDISEDMSDQDMLADLAMDLILGNTTLIKYDFYDAGDLDWKIQRWRVEIDMSAHGNLNKLIPMQ